MPSFKRVTYSLKATDSHQTPQWTQKWSISLSTLPNLCLAYHNITSAYLQKNKSKYSVPRNSNKGITLKVVRSSHSHKENILEKTWPHWYPQVFWNIHSHSEKKIVMFSYTFWNSVPQSYAFFFLKKKQMSFLSWEIMTFVYYLKNKLFTKQQEIEAIKTAEKTSRVKIETPSIMFYSKPLITAIHFKGIERSLILYSHELPTLEAKESCTAVILPMFTASWLRPPSFLHHTYNMAQNTDLFQAELNKWKKLSYHETHTLLNLKTCPSNCCKKISRILYIENCFTVFYNCYVRSDSIHVFSGSQRTE